MKNLYLFFLLFSTVSLAKPYKGAEIYSNTSVLYGRFEFSMKVVKGSGIISNFFLYKNGSEQQDTFWEEIDLEVFGKDNAMAFQSNLITDGTGGSSPIHSEQVHNTAEDLSSDFYDYAIEWTPDYVAWFFNGTEVRRTTGGQVNDLSSPMSLRFNVWSSTSTAWVGSFDAAVLPVNFYIDSIRYSSYANGAFTPEWTDNFDSFNTSRWSKANWTFDGNRVDFIPQNVMVEDGKAVLMMTSESPTGLFLKSSGSKIVVSPNPVTGDYVTLNLEGSKAASINFSISDLLGKVVKQGTVKPGENKVYIGKGKFIPGTYLITFYAGEETYHEKLMVE